MRYQVTYLIQSKRTFYPELDPNLNLLDAAKVWLESNTHLLSGETQSIEPIMVSRWESTCK